MSNLYVISGDAYLGARRLVTTALVAGTAVRIDLTGSDLAFMVKARRRDLDEDALISKTTGAGITIATPQTGDTKGIAYIEIDPEDTADLEGRYLWELAGTDADGPITFDAGRFYVTGDLIRGDGS